VGRVVMRLLAMFSDTRDVSAEIDGGRALRALDLMFKIVNLVRLLSTASGMTAVVIETACNWVKVVSSPSSDR